MDMKRFQLIEAVEEFEGLTGRTLQSKLVENATMGGTSAAGMSAPITEEDDIIPEVEPDDVMTYETLLNTALLNAYDISLEQAGVKHEAILYAHKHNVPVDKMVEAIAKNVGLSKVESYG